MVERQLDLQLERRALCSRALWMEPFEGFVVPQAMNSSALPTLATRRSMARNGKGSLVLMALFSQ
jgi:hypothetical protein